MLQRFQALEQIVRGAGDEACVVSPLGFVTRDLFALTEELRERCFYCMGSMGSVVPLALGISLARPAVHVCAIEGDGSLLMNLGALVTLQRYGGAGKISLFVFDNGCYESTGRQPSQPKNLKIEELCEAAGIDTQVATDTEAIEEFFRTRNNNVSILVVKVATEPPRARVNEEPQLIAQRFVRWLQTSSPA